jgi:predicted nuclease of predicted toxin-antitoxin system
MRFLIDECLSPKLVMTAREAGHEAYHVAHVGKAGWMDWDVARYALEGDFVIVTNNADDFRLLYSNASLHAGLVLFIPSVDRAAQQKLFRRALDDVRVKGELINQVLELDFDGDEITYTRSKLPAGRS